MSAPLPQRPTEPGTFARSLWHAWEGLLHTVVHQRNMRLHVLAGLLVSLVGAAVPLGLAERTVLVFCVVLVFFAELLNTALEALVDLAVEHIDPRAKRVKDVAAAAVLVLAFGTVVLFVAILVADADVVFADLFRVQRQVLVGVPLTVASGVLMHESRRPVAVDVLAFGLGLLLWFLSLGWTHSAVFSAMTLAFLVLSAAASRHRRLGA